MAKSLIDIISKIKDYFNAPRTQPQGGIFNQVAQTPAFKQSVQPIVNTFNTVRSVAQNPVVRNAFNNFVAPTIKTFDPMFSRQVSSVNNVANVFKGFGGEYQAQSQRMGGQNFPAIPTAKYTPTNTSQKIGAGIVTFGGDITYAQNMGLNQAFDDLLKMGTNMIKASPTIAPKVGQLQDFVIKKVNLFLESNKSNPFTFKDAMDVSTGRGTSQQVAMYKNLKEQGILPDLMRMHQKTGRSLRTKVVDFANDIKNYVTEIQPGMTIKPVTQAERDARLKISSQSPTKVAEQPLSVKGVGEVKGTVVAPEGRISTPQVGEAMKVPNKPEVLPQSQITGGGKLPNGQGVSSQPIIPQTDPVQKVIQALTEAKPLEAKQGQIYAKIRSQQAGAVAGVGKNVPGEAGYFAQLSKLKGQMPKVSFESIRKQVTQPDIDALFNKVEQANITPFEKITAKSGLAKLLGGEGGQAPVQSELKLLNEVFPPEFIQAVLSKRPLMSKLFTMGEEALNLPRAIMATADMSAPLRQGIFLVGRPKQWLPAFRDQFKYFFSEKSYQGLMDTIKADPAYLSARDAKLALTDTSPMLLSREETFMSNLAEKIPGFGRVAKASNRAYSGFLNKLRFDTFKDLLKNANELGITKERPNVIKDIATFVNSATGRGNIGGLERAAPVLNGAFFSPRLMASRLNLLNPIFYMKLDPFVRKEALKSLFTFAATATSVLTLARLAGAEVKTDASSDFGKIKIGNTRIDVLGGFQQYIRAAIQLVSGKYVSSTTGKEYTLGEGYKPLTRLGILGKVIESKESPIASFVSMLLTGQNASGGKIDLPAEIVNRFTPMVAADLYDLNKEWGPKGLLMGIPGIFGVGLQTYGKQIPSLETTPAGKPTIKLNPVGGLSEDIVARIRGTQPSNIPQEQWASITATKQQEQQNTILKDKVKKQAEAGNMQPQGNFVPVIVDGTVKVIDKEWTPTDFTVSGIAEIDKARISAYKSSITSRIKDIGILLDNNLITQEDASKQVGELVKSYDAATTKTTKAKKPKKITVSKVKVPKVTISKGKTFKIAKGTTIKKPPVYKIKKVKNIALSIGSSKVKAIKIKPFKNTMVKGFTKLV